MWCTRLVPMAVVEPLKCLMHMQVRALLLHDAYRGTQVVLLPWRAPLGQERTPGEAAVLGPGLKLAALVGSPEM